MLRCMYCGCEVDAECKNCKSCGAEVQANIKLIDTQPNKQEIIDRIESVCDKWQNYTSQISQDIEIKIGTFDKDSYFLCCSKKGIQVKARRKVGLRDPKDVHGRSFMVRCSLDDLPVGIAISTLEALPKFVRKIQSNVGDSGNRVKQAMTETEDLI